MTTKHFRGLLRTYGPHARGRVSWRTVVQMVMERWERWSEDDFDSPSDHHDWQRLYNAAYAIGWGIDTGRFPATVEKKITELTAGKLLDLIASTATKASTIDDAKVEILRRMSKAEDAADNARNVLAERIKVLKGRG